MPKTNFADPFDEFDKEFVNWVVDIMKDVDDPYSSYEDNFNNEDEFDYKFIASLVEKEFDDDSN